MMSENLHDEGPILDCNTLNTVFEVSLKTIKLIHEATLNFIKTTSVSIGYVFIHSATFY